MFCCQYIFRINVRENMFENNVNICLQSGSAYVKIQITVIREELIWVMEKLLRNNRKY